MFNRCTFLILHFKLLILLYMHALSCMHNLWLQYSYVTNKAECFCYTAGILRICMYVCACIAICSLAKSDCSCHLLMGLLLVDTKTSILTIVKLMYYLCITISSTCYAENCKQWSYGEEETSGQAGWSV